MQIVIPGLIALAALTLMIFVFMGKIKSGGQISAYILMTLLPAVAIIALPILAVLAICVIGSPNHEDVRYYPYMLILLENVVFSVYLVIKINIRTRVSRNIENSGDKSRINLESGRRLIKYAIFGAVYYTLLWLIPVCIFVVCNRAGLWYLVTHPAETLEGLLSIIVACLFLPLLVIPIYAIAIIACIVWTGFVVLYVITAVMAVNGIVRLFVFSEHIRKNGIACAVLVIVPVVNLFALGYLCKMAKSELKGQNQQQKVYSV